MMIKFAESGHPVLSSTSPLSRGTLKSKGGESCQYTSVPMERRLKLFRTIISVDQLSIYGAVSDLCEEYKACQVRRERLVVAGQSDPLFEPGSSLMKTPTPLSDDPAHEELLLQRYQERIEKLSQQDRVIKYCTDAGFLKTVEVGQYFMTKDTEEFSQFTDSVACREYTLPRDEKLSDRKGWIRGDTTIGPVLEVTTCCLQGKYGVAIRIGSRNKDHFHSWVRISHGLNKLVTDLNNKEHDDNERETSEMQFEDYALKSKVRAFASRSKANAKPHRRISASSSTKTVSIGERTWTDIEPQDYSSIDYPVSKKLTTLLRHGSLPREDDGAIEFWRVKEYLRNDLERSQHWSGEKWKSTMAGGGGNKKRFQYCTDPSGQEILYLRARHGHSGRNPIDPTLQDNVINSVQFLRVHLPHRMCNQLTLHHNFRIDTGRTKFEQKTDGILYVCGSYEQRTQRSE